MNPFEQVDLLVSGNIGLAFFLARRATDCDLHEAVSRAMSGLLYAAETFNSSRGSFNHYASLCVRRRINNIRQERDAVRRGENPIFVSLDSTLMESDSTLLDLLHCDREEGTERVALLDEALHALRLDQQKMFDFLSMRFGLFGEPHHSIGQIAIRMGIKESRVFSIQRLAIRKLRGMLWMAQAIPLAQSARLQPGVNFNPVLKCRKAPRPSSQTMDHVKELVMSGLSNREIQIRTGVHKQRVGKIRTLMGVTIKCACGKNVGHRGWCKYLFFRSENRQKVMRNLWTKRPLPDCQPTPTEPARSSAATSKARCPCPSS